MSGRFIATVRMLQDCRAQEESKTSKDSALALGSRNPQQADPRELTTYYMEPI